MYKYLYNTRKIVHKIVQVILRRIIAIERRATHVGREKRKDGSVGEMWIVWERTEWRNGGMSEWWNGGMRNGVSVLPHGRHVGIIADDKI